SSSSCSCTPSSMEQNTAIAPSTLWIPLHELQEQWADFGVEALSSVALASTGHAFLALSWEANALRQYHRAWHAHQQGFTANAWTFRVRASDALVNAHRCWSTTRDWLERLINNRALCVSDDDVEQVRALIHDTGEQQRRLALLMQVVEREPFDPARTDASLTTDRPSFWSAAHHQLRHDEQQKRGGAS
ncbi:MAG: hypothetical protein J2P36_22190, partial [Ktedonobacteraceae bacterium]|nr:hypothetical protein [Ktedonobacteraceae bacterium]